jgi:hypothetical protein
MRPQPLNEAELAIVGQNDEDVVLLEIVKGMSYEELVEFDVYTPICMKHYSKIQCKWIATEKQLLNWCRGREVSEEELIEDMGKTKNPERFRAYYVLKYPNFVHRVAIKKSDGKCVMC